MNHTNSMDEATLAKIIKENKAFLTLKFLENHFHCHECDYKYDVTQIKPIIYFHANYAYHAYSCPSCDHPNIIRKHILVL